MAIQANVGTELDKLLVNYPGDGLEAFSICGFLGCLIFVCVRLCMHAVQVRPAIVQTFSRNGANKASVALHLCFKTG